MCPLSFQEEIQRRAAIVNKLPDGVPRKREAAEISEHLGMQKKVWVAIGCQICMVSACL